MAVSQTKDYGIVYLLVNEAMPGLVKIGKTSRKNLDIRMKELFTTGVPLPFTCVHACRVPLERMDELEKALHCAFAPNRVNENREFFRISPEQVKPILCLLDHMTEGDVTAEVEAEIEKDLTDDDKAAVVKSKSKRPPLDFFVMGLQKGDSLVFTGEPACVVTIASARKVLYDGIETSLTALTKDLLKKDYAVQPTRFWTVNGENLLDIYDRTFPFAED
ncbi:MAG: GIY-YIG nuclease family protein [Bacteroides sp.]|nr:GIY-YIG nuclease family protein [Bacteroides sp.]